jgi:hypothetical protein
MTTPTGKLMWGQAGNYDAVDDRATIAAVTRYRTGMAWPPEVVAGTGLNIIVLGGWVGVADCGDRTSAVVASAIDHTVQGIAGPPVASRTDVLWCDVFPDDGTWELRVIQGGGVVGRPGVPLATITVPAGANSATAMQITPVDATLERRLVGWQAGNFGYVEGFGWNDNSWAAAAGMQLTCGPWTMEPGEWYRVKFDIMHAAPWLDANSLESARIGVGYRLANQLPAQSVLGRSASIEWSALNRPTSASVEWIFRYELNYPPNTQWRADGRIWSPTNRWYQLGMVSNEGHNAFLSVEDLGS